MIVNGTRYLHKLRRRYLTFRWLEVVLFSLAIGVVFFSIGMYAEMNISLLIAGATSLAIGIAAVRVNKLQLLGSQNKIIVRLIDHQIPEVHESADLFIKPSGDLNLVEQLQLQRIDSALEQQASIKIPHRLPLASIAIISSLLVSVFLINIKKPNAISFVDKPEASQTLVDEKILPVGIGAIQVQITPPDYTSLPTRASRDLNLEVIEGSAISWKIKLTQSVSNAFIVFGGKDTTKLSTRDEFEFRHIAKRSDFYQVGWTDQKGLVKSSDFYKLITIADESPKIAIENLHQFTELTITDKLELMLRARMTDDYGLTQSHIIATVSKGSGESVKFREEKLFFSMPTKISGKSISASREISLNKLGLEPGDELYFYVEAFDNKKPTAGKSRTETYFISLKDTTSQTISMEGGLGVDLMPEYFRSQRQIIIDSEKLLREKKTISKHDFNFRANELGYDQKVLRLKYGEFLGEEFETSIGPGANADTGEDHGEEEHEDPAKAYGHVHDKENEHNHVPEKKEEHGHNHAGEDNEKPENIADAYKHVHDDPEEATFFTQSIRAKLKAALTVMWDAELHLRMYDPATSLPYQYKALKLLKEISNDSRIYVHKTGFDPPPLKEEKRLTGDLTEAKTSRATNNLIQTKNLPGIRSAINILEELRLEKSSTLTELQRAILIRAGGELASIALEHPARHLQTLSDLKNLSDATNNAASQEVISRVLNSLYKTIPDQESGMVTKGRVSNDLDQAFIDQLNKSRQ